MQVAVLVGVEVVVLVEPFELEEAVAVGGTARTGLVGIVRGDFVHEDDLVAGEGDVGVDVVAEGADVVVPAEFDFIAVVVYLAEVHVRQAGGDDGRQGVRGDQDARAVLLEEIAREMQPVVEEVHVQTDVGLDRGLPGDAGVTRGAQRVAGDAVGTVDAEIVAARVGPDALHVHEAGRGSEVVADLADGGAQFQEVDPVDVF